MGRASRKPTWNHYLYKSGPYSAIGDIAPEYLLSHCAVFAQTLEGLLLLMGYTGASSRKETAACNSVNDEYAEAVKMVLIEKADDRSDRGAHADICRLATADGFGPAGAHEVFPIHRYIPHRGQSVRPLCVGRVAIRYIWLWMGAESFRTIPNIWRILR